MVLALALPLSFLIACQGGEVGGEGGASTGAQDPRAEAGGVDSAGSTSAEAPQTVKVGPQTATLIARVEQFFRRGEHAAGLELARQIDQRLPGTPRIRYLMGAMTGARGEHRDAVEHFEAELQLDPDHIGSLLGLATAHTNLSEPEAAQPFLERALLAEPENPAILLRRGQNLASQGRLEEAVEFVQRARSLATAPSSGAGGKAELLSTIDYELGELARQRRDFVAAEGFFRSALFEDPYHPEATYGLGQSLIRQGRAEEAEAFLRRFDRLSQFDFKRLLEVSRRQPPPAGVFQGIARFHRTRGDLEAAKAAYQRSLELAPQQATSAYGLASILVEQGRLDEATRWALYARIQEPENWRSHYWQGRVRLARGQVEAAEEAFAASRELGAWSADSHLSLAEAYRAGGRYDLAKSALERGLDVDPDGPNLLFEMARLEELQARDAEAEVWLQKTLRAAPTHANGLVLEGIRRHRAGEVEKAAQRFKAARFAQRAQLLGRGQEEEWLSQFATLRGGAEALDAYRRLSSP
ncbi:MAG: tetratricopeptide repeat protein [Acidobacteriota bacterium]